MQYKGCAGETECLKRQNAQGAVHTIAGSRVRTETGARQSLGPLDPQLQQGAAAYGDPPLVQRGIGHLDRRCRPRSRLRPACRIPLGQVQRQLLLVAHGVEQFDIDFSLLGLPASYVVPCDLLHQIVGRHVQVKAVSLAERELQRQLPHQATAIFLDVPHRFGLGRQTPVDLGLGDLGPPLDAKSPGRWQCGFDRLVGRLCLEAAAIRQASQTQLGVGLGDRERQAAGRGGWGLPLRHAPPALPIQWIAHDKLQLFAALALDQ